MFLIFREIELSHIFSKTVFLIFQEIELSSPKFKKIQEGTFQTRNVKKNSLKKFPEMELSSFKLKKLSFISRVNFKIPSLKNYFVFFLIF